MKNRSFKKLIHPPRSSFLSRENVLKRKTREINLVSELTFAFENTFIDQEKKQRPSLESESNQTVSTTSSLYTQSEPNVEPQIAEKEQAKELLEESSVESNVEPEEKSTCLSPMSNMELSSVSSSSMETQSEETSRLIQELPSPRSQPPQQVRIAEKQPAQDPPVLQNRPIQASQIAQKPEEKSIIVDPLSTEDKAIMIDLLPTQEKAIIIDLLSVEDKVTMIDPLPAEENTVIDDSLPMEETRVAENQTSETVPKEPVFPLMIEDWFPLIQKAQFTDDEFDPESFLIGTESTCSTSVSLETQPEINQLATTEKSKPEPHVIKYFNLLAEVKEKIKMLDDPKVDNRKFKLYALKLILGFWEIQEPLPEERKKFYVDLQMYCNNIFLFLDICKMDRQFIQYSNSRKKFLEAAYDLYYELESEFF